MQTGQYQGEHEARSVKKQLHTYITKKFEDQKELLLEYEQHYFDTVTEDSAEFSSSLERMAKRVQSIRATLRNPETFKEKTFEVKEETKIFLDQYCPNLAQDMQKLYGNKLQQAIHKECVDLFDLSAANVDLFSQHHVLDTMVYSTDAAQSYNRYGYIIEALEHVDFCWQLGQVVLGVGEGALLGAHRVVGMVCHPIDTVVGQAQGMYFLAQMLGTITKRVGLIAYETRLNPYNSSITLKETYSDLKMITDVLAKKFAESSTRDIARELTAGVLETYLAQKALRPVFALCREAIVQESVHAASIVAAESEALIIEKIKKHQRFNLAYLLKKSRKNAYKTAALRAQENSILGAEIIDSVALAATSHTGGVLPYITAYCNQKWPLLSAQLIKNFNNSNITIDNIKVWLSPKSILHILKGELYKNGKIGGLHHDPGGFLRKAGMIKIKKMFPNGFYVADIIKDGVVIVENKTFFPESMSGYQVINTIRKSLNKVDEIKIEGLRKVFISKLCSNFELKTVITELGEIITFHPLIKPTI